MDFCLVTVGVSVSETGDFIDFRGGVILVRSVSSTEGGDTGSTTGIGTSTGGVVSVGGTSGLGIATSCAGGSGVSSARHTDNKKT